MATRWPETSIGNEAEHRAPLAHSSSHPPWRSLPTLPQGAMQPSQSEIQREVENLRQLRRRTSQHAGPGAPTLDPDLPDHTLAGADGWSTGVASSAEDYGTASSSSHDDGDEILAPSGDDPANLFWVPARLHPEIAPSEFRQFLKEHARVSTDGTGGLSRANSGASTFSQGLGRKKSMLRKEYDPSTASDSDDEVLPIRRSRGSYQATPQLSLSDLQMLDELADEASRSDDPTKLRTMIKRSLSMNMSPSVIDKMDDLPAGDEADAPILVPPPGQILRRNARTKIRKAGQTQEGAHRFNTRRRGQRRQSDVSSSGDHDSVDRHGSTEDEQPSMPKRPSLTRGVESYQEELSAILSAPRPESMSNDPHRPISLGEVSSIYDAYTRDEPDIDMDDIMAHYAAQQAALAAQKATSTPEPEAVAHPLSPPPELHHPQPQRHLGPPQHDVPIVSRTPSPDEAPSIVSSIESPVPSRPSSAPPEVVAPPPAPAPAPVPAPVAPPVAAPVIAPTPVEPHHPPAPQKSPPRKEKEKPKKGGLFGGWGKGASNTKEKEKPKEQGGFLGGLFGGGKKKAEESVPVGSGVSAGREAAVALLGASKASNRSYAPSPSPQPVNGVYARYPIHVERAIYRLSHIKLANPRRPLYEQVLISNLMFWYLGVINKTQSQSNLPQGQSTPAEGSSTADQEKEAREKEERERAEKERREHERQAQAEQKREPRRGTLTKAPPAGTPPQRRSEMPVRGPQYERQHQAMENEWGQQPARGSGGGPPPQGYGRSGQGGRTPHSAPQPLGLPGGGGGGYDSQHDQRRPQSAPLPPGAMPPNNMGSNPNGGGSGGDWMSLQQQQAQGHPQQQQQGGRQRTQSSSAADAPQPQVRNSRSPPPAGNQRLSGGSGGRYNSAAPEPWQYTPNSGKPGRSLSATANGAPQQGGMQKGRSLSAHATANGQGRRGASEDEDVPLAMWQQQQQQARRR